MRSRITLRKTTPVHVHYDYQYGIAAMLYKKIETCSENSHAAKIIHGIMGDQRFKYN